MKDTIKVFALTTNGNASGAHCPLVNEEFTNELKRTFNYQVRNETIIWLEISKKFICKNKRNEFCKFCPFA